MSTPYMPFYIGDYLRDTQHLTAEQHGIYLLLLMACWSSGALPDDEHTLAGIAKISQFKWKKFRTVFDHYFTKNADGFWHQNRVDYERQRIEKIREERSKAGSKGGSKKQANAIAKLKQNSSTRAGNHNPDKESFLKGRRLRPGASARQRAGGALAPAPAGEAPKPPAATVGGFRTVGRALPHDLRVPLPEASQENRGNGFAAANDREAQRQRAYDFAAQRYPDAQKRVAFLGLSGADPEHDAEWWLDTLGELMEHEQWSDRGEDQ